ncbi:methyltransferase family protein [Pectobacterium carotovorum]|uniref:methyltransferase family protein n=1 Tax=Pectobacterium carotovorum TaxID=554 RepID=UPI001E630D38|nr:methyltransferase dimerization domain-containing protein [Pectobacterium carotovorum]
MNPLETLWQLAASSVKADALHLALEQQIFDRLEEASTPEQLAATLGWQPEKTGFLLELLWSMQLLTRHHDGYRTDPACAAVLLPQQFTFSGRRLALSPHQPAPVWSGAWRRHASASADPTDRVTARCRVGQRRGAANRSGTAGGNG